MIKNVVFDLGNVLISFMPAEYFDGGIISSEIKFSKPDIKIYEKFIDKYSLVPKECLFIDDLEINVKSAENIGMKGHVTFGSPDISSEIKKLLNLTID